MDPRDFRNRYNTALSPQDEAMFQAWSTDESKRQGRNILNDLYDYDLRGLWNSGGGFGGENGHAGDTYKKPNHPTFSDQSQYNGVDGYVGGVWEETPQGMTYTAAGSNMYPPQELQRYFDRAEPGVRLTNSPRGLLDLLALMKE